MTAEQRHSPYQFRERLLAGEPLLGTFMKSPGSHNTEVLGSLGFDFVMLDAEHAPWTRTEIDAGLLAARAFGTAGLVRVARADATSVLQVLDDGAIGVMVPHVDTVEKARNIVSWAHYSGGTRGLGAARGGEYGARGADHIGFADRTTVVIAMIEDAHALEIVDEIVATPGIDCVFLGRGDLGLSLRNSNRPAPTLEEAVEIIAAAARAHGKPLSATVPSVDSDEARWLLGLGVTSLMVASDQGLMARAARASLSEFRTMTRNTVD